MLLRGEGALDENVSRKANPAIEQGLDRQGDAPRLRVGDGRTALDGVLDFHPVGDGFEWDEECFPRPLNGRQHPENRNAQSSVAKNAKDSSVTLALKNEVHGLFGGISLVHVESLSVAQFRQKSPNLRILVGHNSLENAARAAGVVAHGLDLLQGSPHGGLLFQIIGGRCFQSVQAPLLGEQILADASHQWGGQQHLASLAPSWVRGIAFETEARLGFDECPVVEADSGFRRSIKRSCRAIHEEFRVL